MKKNILFSLFVAVFCLLVGALQASENAEEEKADGLFSHFNEGISPGIAVLVVRDGHVLLRKGYGLASLEHKIAITPKTVFDIASVSKQFCGMAVSMLIEEGKISLEDDIRKYIPELPDFGTAITIDHLLHHTSGLRDWPGTLALAGWKMDDVISFDQILDMAFHQQGLNFKPGAEYSYSNTGYNMLAEMVSRVTGLTFRQWTDQNIFEPLGMKDTHFHDDHNEVIPNRAYGYYRAEKETFKAVSNNLTALGSSSLYTTIDDMAKWVKNFEDHKVGGGSVSKRMLERGVLNSGRKMTYAFGLGWGRYRGLNTISHGGSWASFRTYLVHFPEAGFSVVTLLNHSPSNSSKAAFDLVDIYLADRLKARPKAKSRKKKAPESVDVPLSVLDEYVGTYRLGPAWYVTISRKGNRLMSYATQEETVPMTARSQTLFWVEDYGAPILFKRNKEGRVDRFRYRGMECPKLDDSPEPPSVPFSELIGEYESGELKTIYSVVEEDGKLVAEHRRHGKIPLFPAYKDNFRGGAWFMRSVEFTRNEQGEVNGFKVTTGRSRNQRFIKQE
jgi:CubicO group peptidase (beta-lactamase class C family)